MDLIDTATKSSQGIRDSEAASLEAAAAIATSWDVVHRPSSPCKFFARVRAASRKLKKLEAELSRNRIAAPAEPEMTAHRSALIELGTCYRLLRSAVTSLADHTRRVSRLPRIQHADASEEPRMAAVACAYLHAVDGEFSPQSFRRFIRALQTHEALNVDELWNAGAFLQFTLLEWVLEATTALLTSSDSAPIPALLRHLKSLRAIANADWVFLIEPLIALEEILRQDPAEKYGQMDFESRELYRQRIALVARFSDCSESQVAQIAVDLARHGNAIPDADPRVQLRRIHVGYYLMDTGFAQLIDSVGFHPSPGYRAREFVRAHGEEIYPGAIQLFTLLFIAAAIFPVVPVLASFSGLVVAIIVLLFPASENAVALVNNAVTACFDPQPLPKLDFSKGVPAECTTLVAVPTLLLNEQQVRELVNDLEVRFLANRDPHVHFALLTDLPDSVTKPRARDSHPLVDLAIQLIGDLNEKYRAAEHGSFLLLHRHRDFNRRQGVWMGWERKRGKLLDLNSFLAGEHNAFPITAGDISVLNQVRYVLTLDSDTQLPRGAAARLAGALAHPLNQAVIDPKLRIVIAGYGILQPRIGVTVRSTARSRLAAIYSGQSGFDIYTRAASDAYQDLFREGIFTGKGIYEVATLHAVLKGRFPRNALLSHDLIEGAYARAALAADIELIDDYPSHYSAYSRRNHRWVRGDWQVAQWMFSHVPDESGQSVRNPISSISRWKILDNLRRSLVLPSFFILFVAGWLRLPGGPLYWAFVSLLLFAFPAVIRLCFSLGVALTKGQQGAVGDAFAASTQSAFVILLDFALLAHQMLLICDAIFRSFTRLLITGERLLEWETAAQAELRSAQRSPVDQYLAATPLLAAGLGLIVWFTSRHSAAFWCALPILLVWTAAFPVSLWLNAPPRTRQPLQRSDKEFLLTQALLIWRYFQQFGNERHNYLIPDNVHEENLCDAPRVSPTNIGLLLNARQAAFEFGFVTAPELADLTSRSLATVARLEKFRGHLYNWYDTHTLAPLGEERFVSSVDSGNFVASLYTLRGGVHHVARKALLSPALFASLRMHWRLMLEENKLSGGIAKFPLPSASASINDWIEWLPAAHATLASVATIGSSQNRREWWVAETRDRVAAILVLAHDFLPWALPEFRPLRAIPQLEFDEKSNGLCLRDATSFAEALDLRLSRAWETIAADPSLFGIGQRLRTSLTAAIENLRNLSDRLRDIEQNAEKLAEATEFAFLSDPGRQVLSIGYDARTHRLHEACYDMLASEARIATFLAIARGDLPQQSWFKLSRDHVHAYGKFLLLSWTGTMFEYLMPALWMRSYAGTLIARSQKACVAVQRAFARALKIPWGISESGSSHKNESGEYHYQAYGIPRIGLSFEVTAGPVISPYSTFLALGIDSREALRNLRRMACAGWVGPYGLYEAADYSTSLRAPVLTREWMAHHQGMSLIAVLNLLRDNVVQNWFHDNPLIQSAELLLHERPVSQALLKAKLSQLASIRSS